MSHLYTHTLPLFDLSVFGEVMTESLGSEKKLGVGPLDHIRHDDSPDQYLNKIPVNLIFLYVISEFIDFIPQKVYRR